MSQNVWIVSELYYPEETSTGYLLTRIAEGLAGRCAVKVLCAQPSYSARGVRAPVVEEHNGVSIRRCLGTTFNKDYLLARLVNLLTISIAIFVRALLVFRRSDRVIVVTNPPLLPFLVALACRLRGARCILLVHDVYPEVLVTAGFLRPGALFTRLIGWLNRRLYRNVDRVISLGRDMSEVVSHKLPAGGRPSVIIPNWADLDLVSPTSPRQNPLLGELGLSHRFVVQYAGNMGRTHGIETLVEVMKQLSTDPEVHFLFIGSGAKQKWLTTTARDLPLGNVTVLPPRPRTDQPVFLNACDVAIISFLPGMAGISVPSRMYNIMAAGKPIIAVADPDSELAQVVAEEGIGWVVPPNQPDKIAGAIREARADPDLLAEMGRRARAAAEQKYRLDQVIDSYVALLAELDAPPKGNILAGGPAPQRTVRT
jgi:glycosyltransferase involved in cell wall biosynthesis